MGLIAEFKLASPALILGPTLETLPDTRFEIERQYALDGTGLVAFIWSYTSDRQTVDRTLTSDETVESFTRVERTDSRTLYRVQRSESDSIGAYERWVSLGGELLGCRSTGHEWECCMRFPDREAFASYHEFLEDRHVGFTLQRLSDGPTPNATEQLLTGPQAEALQAAYESGFFTVPREATLEDLADTLGVSNQAISERLRRGQARLLEEYFF